MTIDLPAEGVVYCKKIQTAEMEVSEMEERKIGQIKGGNGSNAAFFYYGI